MPKVHFVKKARKDNPVCKRGESYYWWQHAFSPKSYSKTKPKSSQLTKSNYLSQLYALQESINEGAYNDFDSMDTNRQDIVDQLQELSDECQDSLDNMPEQLQESSEAGMTLQERIDMLEDSISSIESIDIPELPEDWSEETTEWDEMDQNEKDEFISEWKQERVNEFIESINDNWPE